MAPAMLALEQRSDARMCYHIMADGIYWDDEIPSGLDEFSGDCLRFVIRYRTSMIMEKPDEQWQEYWNDAMISFPGWIGFDAARCSPEKRLQQAYKTLRKKGEDEISKAVG